MKRNDMIASLSPRVAAVDPQEQAALDAKIEAARVTAPRVMHVTREQIDQHPHGLLLVLVQHVLYGLQQRDSPIARDVPAYSADPEAFARQMETFERMRETERRAKAEQR